jgi:hypothetical protein
MAGFYQTSRFHTVWTHIGHLGLDRRSWDVPEFGGFDTLVTTGAARVAARGIDKPVKNRAISVGE